MADSSVNAKIELLENYGLIPNGYVDLGMQLLPYQSVSIENMENAIVKLIDHVSINMIRGKQDLPFLTLKPDEVKVFEDFFVKDPSLKFETFRSFIGKPTKLLNRITHCMDYGIPYKNENNELLPILYSEDAACKLYLSGYFKKENKESDDNKLSEDEIELFTKVCAILQKLVHDNGTGPLIIFEPLESKIIETIKSNPNLSEEKLAYEIIMSYQSLQTLTQGITIPFAESNSDSGRRQTGQR